MRLGRVAQEVDAVPFEQNVASRGNEGTSATVVVDSHLPGKCSKASVKVGIACIGAATELGDIATGRIPGIPDETVLVAHGERRTRVRDGCLEREDRIGWPSRERLSHVRKRPIGGDERTVGKWLLGFAVTCSLKAMLVEVDCTHVKTVDELSPAVTKGAKYIRIELATLDAAHLNLMQVDTDVRCKTMHIAELGFT